MLALVLAATCAALAPATVSAAVPPESAPTPSVGSKPVPTRLLADVPEQRDLRQSPRGGVHIAKVGNSSTEAGLSGATVDGSVPPLLPGSPIQHNIRVYVIYWGSSWNCSEGASCAALRLSRSRIDGFFSNVSHSAHQALLHQYYDGGGHISDAVEFAGSVVDPSNPPTTVGRQGTAGDVPAEIARMMSAQHWTNSSDTQVIVVPQPGPTAVSPDGSGAGTFCGYHGFDSANGDPTADPYVYALVPWAPDVQGCVVRSTSNADDDIANSMTRVVSHEYAEAATNPDATNGWHASNPGHPDSEIGDMCNFLTGVDFGITVQQEWDNAQDACATTGSPLAVQALPGDACNRNVLAANDDGSTGAVALPFTLNFFGNTYASAFVNNNGNITFDQALRTFTPFGLTTHLGTPIIAPFFADVDTRGSNSGLVHYGATDDGHIFCVNWVDVGYYSGRTDKLASFQLLLVDRSGNPGGAPGDFDIVMNYDHVQWETGDASGGVNGLGGFSAHVGYSNGTGVPGTFFELQGSGVNGALIDSGPAGLTHTNQNAPGQNGRYVYAVRHGSAPTGGTISGRVYANSAAPANALPGAFVQVCPSAGPCRTSSTGADGSYQVGGLPDGQYNIRALPPGGSTLLPATRGPETVAGGNNLAGRDLILAGPAPIPTGSTITSLRVTPGGVPVLYWNDPLILTTHGCPGGTASYIVEHGGTVIASGPMAASGDTFTATIPPLHPNTGSGRVTITIHCPDGTTQAVVFDVYIDPSGKVVDQAGNPVVGATVTLLRSDDPAGPFVAVPDGSGIMSPTNRTNPGTSDGRGLFGWDVLAGYYQVRAEHAGCRSADDPTRTFALTPVLTVPPPVTDLVLRLQCVVPNQPPTAAFTVTPASGVAPLAVNLNASGSSDSDGSIVAYRWDFGDGATAAGVAVAHTFTAAGAYTVTLTVTDDKGASATTAHPVTVTAPVGGRTVTLRATGSGGAELWSATGVVPDGALTVVIAPDGRVQSVTGTAVVTNGAETTQATFTIGAARRSRDFQGMIKVSGRPEEQNLDFTVRGGLRALPGGGVSGQGHGQRCDNRGCSKVTLSWQIT